MLTVQGFREAYPQFTAELFPDARVEFYLRLAGKSLSPERWADMLIEGAALFAAHYLTLEREALKDATGAGGIAAAAGPVTAESKTVGGVSKSVTRAGAGMAQDARAGQWNLTWYGQAYWQLAQIVGAGGTVL